VLKRLEDGVVVPLGDGVEGVRAQESTLSPIDKLREISGNPDALREKLMNSDPIIPQMLVRGTTSVWYALPNGGKTLFTMRSIIDAIQKERLDGSYTFYINEDDNLDGFIQKSELAQLYGFSMISSVQSTDDTIRNAGDILELLVKIADMPECAKVFVVIDTLKKFTSVMSKDAVPGFFKLMRKLNAGGGTVLILSHANKRNDPTLPLIPAGVQDIQDDIDVMYAIENLSLRDDSIQKCEFKCTKDRGPVSQSIPWQYVKSPLYTYPEMIESIKRIDDDGIEDVRNEQVRAKVLKKYRDEAAFLEAVLRTGEMMQKDILAAVGDEDKNSNAVSKRAVRHAIDALAGITLSVTTDKMRNNAKLVEWVG
jgi:hypothetical protein